MFVQPLTPEWIDHFKDTFGGRQNVHPFLHELIGNGILEIPCGAHVRFGAYHVSKQLSQIWQQKHVRTLRLFPVGMATSTMLDPADNQAQYHLYQHFLALCVDSIP